MSNRIENKELKCKDCDYCSYDSWNNPNGYFCEWKTTDEDQDFMETRINQEDSSCEKFAHIGEG